MIYCNVKGTFMIMSIFNEIILINISHQFDVIEITPHQNVNHIFLSYIN